MRQAIIILLVCSIFLQAFSKVWIFISFKINQDRIARTLCVMRESAQNTCQGNCVLMRRLAADKTAEKNRIPAEMQEKPPFVHVLGSLTGPTAHIGLSVPAKAAFSHPEEKYALLRVLGIFRPPQVLG